MSAIKNSIFNSNI